MFRFYLKYSWRNLMQNRTSLLLNMGGLTAGLVCFAFIALWVTDEWKYDRFNAHYDRIVRVTGNIKTETGLLSAATTSAPMARALQEDYAEVEKAVRVDMREEIITHKGQQVLQPGILLADPSFFEVFSYHLSRGNAATALTEPYSIILTVSSAKKYFGDADPMGQSLLLNMHDPDGNGTAYKVTGVMPDPPANAHFTFNMIASFRTIEVARPDVLTIDGWGDASYYTYLLLKKGVDQQAFSRKIAQFYAKHIGELYPIWRSLYTYQLQPLGDIHLRSNLQYEIAPTGNATQVYIFSTIGVFILLLAGINYVNLATAHSISRAKATGIKKVVGARRGQLIRQCLLETVIVAIMAWIVALLACSLLQPVFFRITGKELSLFSYPGLIFFLAGVTFLVGILSGIYPAWMIAGFRPLLVLKGALRSDGKGVLLRKVLVVSQFTITLLLIIGITVIYSQLSYIRNKDLGYNKDPLLFLRVHGNAAVMKGFTAFRNELLASPLIAGVAVSNSLLGSVGSGGSETIDDKGNPLQVNTARLRVDPAYLGVYGIKLVAGRNFERAAAGDSIRPVILNEAAVAKFGWKAASAAIGKPFTMGGQPGMVTGVVKDFHFSSLQQLIGPLAISPIGEGFSRITLKTDITRPAAVSAWVEKTWKKHFPAALLDYTFSDQAFAQQYQAEQRFSDIFLCFAVLSLFIACLGSYGLIAYTTFQKNKEIGIRKVLGATARSIMILLTTDYLRLVILAFLVAAPLAWYIMNRWLDDFAYRTSIAWWMFAIAGGVVLLVSLITISFKAISAALVNPVKSMRME